MSNHDPRGSARAETVPDGPPARMRRSSLASILLLLAASCLAVAGVMALRSGPASHPAAGRAAFSVPEQRFVPLGTMRIPRIGLETPFYPGVHDDVVALGPGLWPGTPLPGAPGNAVFAGHRTIHTHPFGDLDRLAPGDVIETALGSASPVEFQVAATAVVPEAQYVDAVLRQPADSQERWITLFACAPKGRRTHRIVVQATAVQVGTAGPAPDEGTEGRDVDRPNATG